MRGDNHQSERQGDSVRFTVRPESAAIFYAYDWVLWMALLTTVLMMTVVRGVTGAHLSAAMTLAAPLAVLLILVMPGNRYRRRHHFEVRPDAVVIAPATLEDGLNPAVLAGLKARPVEVPRAQIREVVVRNTVAGSWSHRLALGDLDSPNRVYAGVGEVGFAMAGGMAAADQVATGVRRLRHGITIGPRVRRAYYVALRLGKAEHVIGGGLDPQGAADLARDVAEVLSAGPRAA